MLLPKKDYKLLTMFFVVYNIALALVVSVDSLVHADDIRRVGSREVATKYGLIRGVLVTLPNKNIGPVEVFLGIPYATPPVGVRRFMPPIEPSQWHGVRAVDRYSPVCPQRLPDIRNETETLRHMPAGRYEYLKKLLPFLRNQSEDCLYLNVYCPGKFSITLPLF